MLRPRLLDREHADLGHVFGFAHGEPEGFVAQGAVGEAQDADFALDVAWASREERDFDREWSVARGLADKHFGPAATLSTQPAPARASPSDVHKLAALVPHVQVEVRALSEA